MSPPMPLKQQQALSQSKKIKGPTPGYKHGHVAGIPVGTTFSSRKDCNASGVHKATCQGIFHKDRNAYAICLNGEYENDVDDGLRISYTGAGGKTNNFETKKGICTDQDWKAPSNRALLRAHQERKPIRVIRGYKLGSIYAPRKGYRYDGLYRIYKVYTKVTDDENRYRLCMYELQRLSNQPPPPWETKSVPHRGNNGQSSM
ncbi:PUA-like domain-containing protein, partial [Lentinula raphanica]